MTILSKGKLVQESENILHIKRTYLVYSRKLRVENLFSVPEYLFLIVRKLNKPHFSTRDNIYSELRMLVVCTPI